MRPDAFPVVYVRNAHGIRSFIPRVVDGEWVCDYSLEQGRNGRGVVEPGTKCEGGKDSLVLYSGEGTITVTRHADGKATVEMFDQRTIRDLIDREDRIKLAQFLSENP
jgi:hypothetical protein